MLSLAGMILAAAASAQGCAPGPLAAELEARFERDQAARRAIAEHGQTDETLQRVLDVDRENRAWLEAILVECGWPRRSKVGDHAAHAAWRLALQADRDLDFQQSAAAAMRQAVEQGEASASAYALLVDRRLRLQDKPQRYGMQYDTGDSIEFWPIEAPEELDQRRRAIGLTLFYCRVMTLEERQGSEAEWPEGVPREPVDCDGDE